MKSWEELSRKEQLHEILWDMYKDAHGMRPRHLDISSMSEDDMETEIDRLEVIIEQQVEEQKIQQIKNAESVEQRITQMLQDGIESRSAAIGILHEENETHGDDNYLCYKLNLKYSYFATPENKLSRTTKSPSM